MCLYNHTEAQKFIITSASLLGPELVLTGSTLTGSGLSTPLALKEVWLHTVEYMHICLVKLNQCIWLIATASNYALPVLKKRSDYHITNW